MQPNATSTISKANVGIAGDNSWVGFSIVKPNGDTMELYFTPTQAYLNVNGTRVKTWT